MWWKLQPRRRRSPGRCRGSVMSPATCRRCWLAATRIEPGRNLRGGKVNESLQTLAQGRRKFGRSTDLQDLEVRYVQAADIYDRLSSA